MKLCTYIDTLTRFIHKKFGYGFPVVALEDLTDEQQKAFWDYVRVEILPQVDDIIDVPAEYYTIYMNLWKKQNLPEE